MMDILKNGIKWIPNLFTLGNLLLGFYATIISIQSQNNPEMLKLSGILIMIAAFLDGLDGFFARIFKATSEIGAQLDSLADLTAFGIAPGALFYMMYLNDTNIYLGNLILPFGMILSGIYPASVAYRLARFNVSHSSDSFDGLPSPIGGMIIALIPLIIYEIQIQIPKQIFIFIFILSSYLMISTIRYSKIQVSLFRKFSKLRAILLISFIWILLISLYIKFGIEIAASGLFILILLYIFSGIIAFIIHLIQEYKL